MAKQDISTAVEEQIQELQPGSKKELQLARVSKELRNLRHYVVGESADVDALLVDSSNILTTFMSGQSPISELGSLLGNLDIVKLIFESTGVENDHQKILSNIIVQIEGILSYRPSVDSVMNDLEALRDLKGGPADAISFHDFHSLQIAFKSVWKHAFSGTVLRLLETIYLEHTKLYDDLGVELPPIDALSDINQIEDFKKQVEDSISGLKDEDTPPEVIQAFPASLSVWHLLSGGQKFSIYLIAVFVLDTTNSQNQIDQYKRTAEAIFASPDGSAGRLSNLILELGKALNEPYSFDLFAPHSYNFGLVSTYRQIWEPGKYQAGDLVSTIPLAPGESRKYSKKINIKRSRSEKEIEKSVSSSSYQTSETSRAENDIMKKSASATNFKMTASGAFSIGIASINASTEFGGSQSQESIDSKKNFHEATIKAAQDYRLERSMEIDTSLNTESDEVISGEISNPNNEITVTYLFYELQRRYLISEYLYRVQPVILVALDVPLPHEIDEAWLIQYQWIIGRVLLDESFRPALSYLTSGFAGDELSIEVIKSHWIVQKRLAESLESQVNAQLTQRDSLRETLIQTAEEKALSDTTEMPLAAKILTLGLAPDPSGIDAERSEAYRRSAETRLQYVEQALADAQAKLNQAQNVFAQSTREYAAAMANQYSRHVSVDQLRIHVKQNILYYMQAIWSHKVADQTFFELYKLPIDCPSPQNVSLSVKVESTGIRMTSSQFALTADLPIAASTWDEHELVEMADIDNPLGFKGNYIILALKEHCYLTWFMLTEFIDEFTRGLKDPDSIRHFLESFDDLWLSTLHSANGTVNFGGQDLNQQDLKEKLEQYVSIRERISDEIIVPTGQLFIEALPGSHPLIEDFKLLHRIEDVRKVKAEVRHAELENLRLAARLLANQNDPAKDNLLDDPDIEKKVIIQGGEDLVVDAN